SKNGLVTSFAGSGKAGFKDGYQTEAMFYYPTGLAIDKNGNLFVADTYNHRIRKISPNGIVSTIAGSGKSGNIDGQSNNACFNFPMSVVSDNSGNIFVTDFGNCTIREISEDGNVSTFAGSGFISDVDGIGTDASFNYPTGITIDNLGNLFVVDRGNNKIKKITPDHTVFTFTGNGQSGQIDGSADIAQFNNPYGISIDQNGNLYVTDVDNNAIRKISTTGNVSTITGQGIAGSTDGFIKNATLNSPSGIAVDTNGVIIFADQLNNKIRKITRSPLYKITPELSSGLYFDEKTGSISGTPTVTSPATTYAIIGTNDFGSYQTKINITVYDTLTAPTVTTQEVSDISSSTAVGHGTIENLGMPYPTSYGICWNTTGTPTIEDQHTDNGNATDTGAFVSTVSGLAYNTTFYVRAYATNEAGTSYGNEVSFTTKKCQLTAIAPVITLSKTYDSTVKALIDSSSVHLSNLASNDQVTLSCSASYDSKNTGNDKKITVSYTISGPDAYKYIAPEDYFSTNGSITPIALTGLNATVNNKIYDGNTSVNISDVYPIGIIDGDQVGITINNAHFSDKNVGLNKSVIIPELSITGADANNYTLPQLPSLNASISKRQLIIESTQVTTNKMHDATTTANIISTGSLSNLVSGDDIQVSAQANYDSPEIGSDKVITVTYILSGKDTANYDTPKALVISNAIISDKVTIQSLQTYLQECETSSFKMDYVTQSGTPIQYKITFNDKALSAGFINTEFSNLPSASINGTLTIPIPQGAKYGNYSFSARWTHMGIHCQVYLLENRLNLDGHWANMRKISVKRNFFI
ncbi:MAG: YDG domain-containing protein, partial [Bacteroidota bacterium]|nr:YDG domain-containing protein [Bacteroidota bacterium]